MWIFLAWAAGIVMVGIAVVRLFFYDYWLAMKIEWHLHLKKRPDRALPYVRKSFERMRRSKGENHLETNVSRYNLGSIFYESGLKEQGQAMVEKAAEFFDSYQGPQDALFPSHLLNLAVAQRAIEQKEQALLTMRRVLEIQRRQNPSDEVAIARTQLNLGALLQETNHPEEALRVYEESLQVRIAKFGEASTEVSRIRINRAECFIDLQNWLEAERNVSQGIAFFSTMPHCLEDLGQSYDVQARLMEAQELYTDAEYTREKSLIALRRALGETNAEVIKQMDKQASLLGRMNRHTEKELYEKKAAELREALKCSVS